MFKLEHNHILGRMLRVDDLETLGVSTQTLAEDAIQAGRVDEAIALVDYFHQEMRTMHTIMRTWLTDITRYIIARGSGADDPGQIGDLSYMLFDIWRTYPFGEAVRERCKAAIGEGEAVQAIDLLDHMRLEFKVPHDVLVAWVQNLLTTIAARWGEEAVLEFDPGDAPKHLGRPLRELGQDDAAREDGVDRGGHPRRALQRRAPPRRHDAAR